MTTVQLLLLATLTLMGVWVSAKWEAREMSLQRKIHHWLLMLVRFLVAILLIRLIAQPPDLLEYLPPLVMAAGLFGPTHRLLLWYTRTHKYPRQNRNIPWHHLSMRGYDLIVYWIPNPKTRFTCLTLIELLVAGAGYHQSQA